MNSNRGRLDCQAKRGISCPFYSISILSFQAKFQAFMPGMTENQNAAYRNARRRFGIALVRVLGF
jgi:hypothetical protein